MNHILALQAWDNYGTSVGAFNNDQQQCVIKADLLHAPWLLNMHFKQLLGRLYTDDVNIDSLNRGANVTSST